VRVRPAWTLAAALVLLAVAAALLPVNDWVREVLAWTSLHRKVSGLIYLALYVIATVCLVPGLLITLAGGALFGFAAGTALVSVSSVAGATAAFLVGRMLAREWVARKTAAWPKFRALDRALRARGFWIVLLTRLSPAFPFNLLNYAYGISEVRLRDYVLGSWIGMLPATALYVYAGAAAASLTQAASGRVQLGGSRWLLLGVGLAATAAVVVLVTRVARRQLERELTA
jgi:uncharacterized membrane protein YdjX (TVP38/TMEM64 family)